MALSAREQNPVCTLGSYIVVLPSLFHGLTKKETTCHLFTIRLFQGARRVAFAAGADSALHLRIGRSASDISGTSMAGAEMFRIAIGQRPETWRIPGVERVFKGRAEREASMCAQNQFGRSSSNRYGTLLTCINTTCHTC